MRLLGILKPLQPLQAQTWRQQIDEFRRLVIAADAQRASQLLVDACNEYPLLAGIVTLLRQGSIDQAVNNIGLFDAGLAADLRGHRETIEAIRVELNKEQP